MLFQVIIIISHTIHIYTIIHILILSFLGTSIVHYQQYRLFSMISAIKLSMNHPSSFFSMLSTGRVLAD